MGILGFLDRLVTQWGPRGYIAGVTRYPLGNFPEATKGRAIGVVKPLDQRVLEAPLSGRMCVYHEIEILDDRGLEGGRVRVAHEQRGLPFVLEDETGRAVVNPEGARSVCVFDRRESSKAMFDAKPRQRAIFERHSLSAEMNWWGSRGLHYREAVIMFDERLTVVGMGTREPDPDRQPGREQGYRDGGVTRMHFSSTRGHQLILSDDPKFRNRGE
jgi:hypothetical protein